MNKLNFRLTSEPMRPENFGPDASSQAVVPTEGWSVYQLSWGHREWGPDYKNIPFAPDDAPVWLVGGEPGAGMSSFAAWLVHHCQARVVFLNEPPLPEGAQKRYQAICQNIGGGADMMTLSAALATPRHVLVHNFDELDAHTAELFLGSLVAVLESEKPPKKSLILGASRNVSIFRNSATFSEIVSRTNLCRLAYWEAAQVAQLWGATEDSAEVVRCVEWTGGNPALVQLMTQNLLDDARLEDIGQKWLLDPPRLAQSWQKQLAALIRDLQTRHIIQALVADQSLPESGDSGQFRDLFLAGWIRRHPDPDRPEWVIRSKSHRAWAAAVLRNPGRFGGVL